MRPWPRITFREAATSLRQHAPYASTGSARGDQVVSHAPDMPHGAAGSDGFHRRHDAVRVDAVMAVELRQRSRLTEMFHAQRAGTVTQDCAQPAQRGGMAV